MPSLILLNDFKWNIFTTACILTMPKQSIFYFVLVESLVKSSQEVYRKQKCVRDQKCLFGLCVSQRWWAENERAHGLQRGFVTVSRRCVCIHTSDPARGGNKHKHTRKLSQDAGVCCCLYLIYLHPWVTHGYYRSFHYTFVYESYFKTSEQS